MLGKMHLTICKKKKKAVEKINYLVPTPKADDKHSQVPGKIK